MLFHRQEKRETAGVRVAVGRAPPATAASPGDANGDLRRPPLRPTGATTSRRSGSSPSLYVSTSWRSRRCSCTSLRSIAFIASRRRGGRRAPPSRRPDRRLRAARQRGELGSQPHPPLPICAGLEPGKRSGKRDAESRRSCGHGRHQCPASSPTNSPTSALIVLVHDNSASSSRRSRSGASRLPARGSSRRHGAQAPLPRAAEITPLLVRHLATLPTPPSASSSSAASGGGPGAASRRGRCRLPHRGLALLARLGQASKRGRPSPAPPARSPSAWRRPRSRFCARCRLFGPRRRWLPSAA